MQFIVIGRDGTDEGALDRRMKVREDHLKMAAQMKDAGRWLYAVAILNEKDHMTGSVIVCDFEDEAALKSLWLDKEPYVLGKVWEQIEISRAAVPPHFQ